MSLLRRLYGILHESEHAIYLNSLLDQTLSDKQFSTTIDDDAGLLIQGTMGGGKTTLLQLIGDYIGKSSCIYIDCSTFYMKDRNSVESSLQGLSDQIACSRTLNVVLLDNIDCLWSPSAPTNRGIATCPSFTSLLLHSMDIKDECSYKNNDSSDSKEDEDGGGTWMPVHQSRVIFIATCTTEEEVHPGFKQPYRLGQPMRMTLPNVEQRFQTVQDALSQTQLMAARLHIVYDHMPTTTTSTSTTTGATSMKTTSASSSSKIDAVHVDLCREMALRTKGFTNGDVIRVIQEVCQRAVVNHSIHHNGLAGAGTGAGAGAGNCSNLSVSGNGIFSTGLPIGVNYTGGSIGDDDYDREDDHVICVSSRELLCAAECVTPSSLLEQSTTSSSASGRQGSADSASNNQVLSAFLHTFQQPFSATSSSSSSGHDGANRASSSPGTTTTTTTTSSSSAPRVFGMHATKQRLLDALRTITHPTFRRCSGILITGPSGSGKTLLSYWLGYQASASANANANRSGGTSVNTMSGNVLGAAPSLQQLSHYCSFLCIPCADLVHKVVGESEQKIAQIFAAARSLAPCIVLLDNIDMLLGATSKPLDADEGQEEQDESDADSGENKHPYSPYSKQSPPLLKRKAKSAHRGTSRTHSRSRTRTRHQAVDRLLSTLLVEIDGIGDVEAGAGGGGGGGGWNTSNLILPKWKEGPPNKPTHTPTPTPFTSSYSSSFERPVLVVATTTSKECLDRALLRPGRLEEHVELSLPDYQDRHEYISHLLLFSTQPHGQDQEEEEKLTRQVSQCATLVAQATVGRSFAHLQSLVQEANMAYLREQFQFHEQERAKTPGTAAAEVITSESPLDGAETYERNMSKQKSKSKTHAQLLTEKLNYIIDYLSKQFKNPFAAVA